MMTTLDRVVKLSLVIALVTFMAACQAVGTKGPVTGEVSSQAVRCDKCQITWVKVPTNDPKGRFIGYSDKKVMECPECHSAVANFFSTGKLQHSCNSCGGNLAICESH